MSAQDRQRLSDHIESRIAAGDLSGALAACRQLNLDDPGYAWGWYLASFASRKARRYADALGAIGRALRIERADRYVLERVKCLTESGDLDAARAAVVELAGRDLGDAALHDDAGGVLHRLGDQRAALEQYTRACSLAPRVARHHYNRATVLRFLGDAEGAEAAFDAAIALRPRDYEALHGRSHLRRQTRERNHVAELEAALAGTGDTAGRIELCYALAKELEDLGEHAASFARLKEGAGLKRRQMRYDVATDLAIMERIRAVYRAERLAGAPAAGRGAGVIFVFGMPRTGTTLVERILSSHPDVSSAGELSTFSLELTRLTQALPGPTPVSRADFVDRTAALDFGALGEAYLHASRPYHDARPVFIDKLPFNYLYAGLIRLALPGARMVSLERHPLDTCYAMYKQLFKDAYPFSYDLDDLGRYYVAYAELMQHWHHAMPGAIHTVRYEDLVRDLEGESRRLVAYCGLAWDERCLRFDENAAASTTASSLQVRQPIYASSVGRWRSYATELEPLRARIAAAGIAVD